MRKASFSIESSTPSGALHNLRINAPKYLIETDKEFNGNIYLSYFNKVKILQDAQVNYQEAVGQKMQQKQIDNFYKETVISMEKNHTVEDIENLFKVLNEKYGGHKLMDIAIHKDEGHFLKDGIEYYPTKHILKKGEDWFIASDFEKEELTNDDFNTKVNIKDFKKIYNYHCHATFSMFDEDLGKSARMKKKDMQERYKLVAETLELNYAPDKDTRLEKKHIGTYKNDLSKARNEKLKAVNKQITIQSEIMDKKLTQANKVHLVEKQEDLATINDLKKEMREIRSSFKDNRANRSDYAKLEQLNKELLVQLKEKELSAISMKNQLTNLTNMILKNNNIITGQAKEICELNVEIDLHINKSGEEYKKLSEAHEIILEQKTSISTTKEENVILKQSMEDLEVTYDKANNCLIKIASIVNYDGDETKELIKCVKKIKEERDSLMNIINRAIEWVQNDVPSLIREFIYSFNSEFKRDENLKDYEDSNKCTTNKRYESIENTDDNDTKHKNRIK